MSRYLRLPDSTVWPAPWPASEDEAAVEWLLRYHGPTPLDRPTELTAASVCHAYAHLIAMPRRRREQVIAAIRSAAAARSQP